MIGLVEHFPVSVIRKSSTCTRVLKEGLLYLTLRSEPDEGVAKAHVHVSVCMLELS